MKKTKHLDIDNKEILLRVESDIAKDDADFSEYRVDNRKLWTEIYQALPDEKAKTGTGQPFDKDRTPFIKITKETAEPRILAAVNKPPEIIPTEETDVEKVKANKDYLLHIINNKIKDFEGKAAKIVDITMVEGSTLVHIPWVKNTRKDISFYHFPAEVEEQQIVQDEITGQQQQVWTKRNLDYKDILPQIFPEEIIRIIGEPKELSGDRIKIKYNELNTKDNESQSEDEKEAIISFTINDITKIITAKVEQLIVDFEGVEINVKPIDDVYFPVDADDIQTCDHLIFRFITTVSELRKKAETQEYIIEDDQWNKIKSSAKTTRIVKQDTREEDQKLLEGAAIAEPPEYSYEVEGYECYYLWDIDGNGMLDQVIFTVLPDCNMVIRKKYLSEIFPHNMRPFELNIWKPRRYRMLGIGIVEDLMPLQKLINDLVRMTLNASASSIMPPGFYDPALVGSNTGIQEYENGKLYPFPPGSISWKPIPTNIGPVFEMIKFFVDLLQKQGATSDQLQGQPGGVKTATATVRLANEAYMNMSERIKGQVRFFGRLLNQVWKLNHINMPKEEKYRIMGPKSEAEFPTMSKKDIMRNVDIKIQYSTEDNNTGYRMAAIDKMVQFIFNPMFVQAGIVNPKNWYNMLKKVFEELNMKDFHNYITEPNIPESIDPEKEFYMMLEGQEVPTSPTDDDQGHLQKHMELKNTAGQYISSPEEYTPLIQRIDNHIELHVKQQIMKVIQQQQAMQQIAMQAQQQGEKPQGARQDPNLQGRVSGPMTPGFNEQGQPMVNMQGPMGGIG